MTSSTPDNTEPLVADLVDWVAKEPRPYAEVMKAWRTTCPPVNRHKHLTFENFPDS
jgi:hypothetical protein